MPKIPKFQNQVFSVENFLDQHFSTKNVSKKVWVFFRRTFFRWTFFWTPMSIQNFPRIPKIILRNPCGESKDAKKQFKHHNLVWRSDKNSTGTLAFELPTGWSVKGLSMANFGFSSETARKYENRRSQGYAGTIGVVSIFNTIVLVIHLAYGKPFPDKPSGCELVSENLKISYFVWISSHLCTKVISLATTVVISDIFLRDRAEIRKVQTSNLFRHRRRCFYPQ